MWINFFSPLYKSKQKRLWANVANHISGNFIDGGFLKTDVIKYNHNGWQIYLYQHIKYYGKGRRTIITTMKASFINESGFNFSINKDFFKGFGSSIFGTQDIKVGDTEFDKNFTIKANYVRSIELILNTKRIKELIYELSKKINFNLENNRSNNNIDSLILQYEGFLINEELIIKAFDLFSIFLEKMQEINIAKKLENNHQAIVLETHKEITNTNFITVYDILVIIALLIFIIYGF